MRKYLFWRLFVILSLGVVTFFSILHSIALRSDDRMSYLAPEYQDEILSWGKKAQQMLDKGEWRELDEWLNELAKKENTWATVVRSQIDVLAGNELNERFSQGYNIGRDVSWKIHLYFPDNPIMEVTLDPFDTHFLIILPTRMRPGTYAPYLFWLFRAIIPFCTLFVLTLFIYRQVMVPLKRLHTAAIELNNGNYQARISDGANLGNDEFSIVSKTFDSMAERTASLIDHNRNLIADMSHEIRTPLARVEMALDCIDQKIDSKAMVSKIRSEVIQVRQIAEDTLTLAWIENERPDLRMESFDLRELLDIIVEDAQFEYPDRIIELDAPDTLIVTRSNQRAVSYAVENIVRNGLRYTPPRQPLLIRAFQDAEDIRLTITDCGPGIAPELCQKIFTPFFKADNQVSSRKGFGVGLALAKRHIEAVKGSIKAKNSHDQGLSFIIHLPVNS